MPMKKIEGTVGKTVEKRKFTPRVRRNRRMVRRAHKQILNMWRDMQQRYDDNNPRWFRVKFPERRHESKKESFGEAVL